MRPKQPIASPAAIRGSHCCFCSSRAEARGSANIASEPCTETSERMPESPASSSQAGDAVDRGRGAGAAVALQVHAEQAEVAELLGELAGGQRAVDEPVRDVRADVLVDHRGDGGLGVALVLAVSSASRANRSSGVRGLVVAGVIVSPLAQVLPRYPPAPRPARPAASGTEHPTPAPGPRPTHPAPAAGPRRPAPAPGPRHPAPGTRTRPAPGPRSPAAAPGARRPTGSPSRVIRRS